MNEDSREDAEQERPRPRVVDKRVSARPAEPPEAPAPEPSEPAAQPSEPGRPPEDEPSPPPSAGEEPPGADVWTPEREEQARRLAEELARAPARDIVVTMAMNFVEVASVKIDAGDFPGAQLAIDAFDGVIQALGNRLGDAEGPLRQMLAQLQMAFAQRASQPPPSAG
ncbi:MAG TPA: hypothetical protein VFA00_06430 [Actinomycetota bacterium]|nr:hypothetical protein [Actinomycetota bacterium]